MAYIFTKNLNNILNDFLGSKLGMFNLYALAWEGVRVWPNSISLLRAHLLVPSLFCIKHVILSIYIDWGFLFHIVDVLIKILFLALIKLSDLHVILRTLHRCCSWWLMLRLLKRWQLSIEHLLVSTLGHQNRFTLIVVNHKLMCNNAMLNKLRKKYMISHLKICALFC